MWLMAVGSLFGPILFALQDRPFFLVVCWALTCAAVFMWKERQTLVAAQQTAGLESRGIGVKFITLLLFISIAAVITAAHAGTFFLVGALR